MPIVLPEALALLQSGQWCSLRYITANTSKGSGGKVIELAKCKIARRQSEAVKSDSGNKSAAIFSHVEKNPNHGFHFTRNIELQNKAIRTVYPILITHINHQAVL